MYSLRLAPVRRQTSSAPVGERKRNCKSIAAALRLNRIGVAQFAAIDNGRRLDYNPLFLLLGLFCRSLAAGGRWLISIDISKYPAIGRQGAAE